MPTSAAPRTAGPFLFDGTDTSFPFAFEVFDDSEVVFTVTAPDGSTSTKALNVDFSVTLNVDQTTTPGGTVTYPISGAAGASGYFATITGELPLDQPFRAPTAGRFPSEAVTAAFDRTVRQIKQVDEAVDRSLRVPVGETAVLLPSREARKNKQPVFDAYGDMIAAVPASGSAAEVFVQLAGTGAGQGAGLVGWLRTLVGSVASTVAEWLGWGEANLLECLSPAERTDVISYTGAIDVTTKVNAFLAACHAAGRDVHAPAGLYRVTTLVLPGSQAIRNKPWRFRGQGCGELFARGMNGGTIFYHASAQTVPLLQYVPDVVNTGNGAAEVCHIRFEANTTVAALKFDTFYDKSELHHCGIYQAGTGGGLEIALSNTIEVHHNYIMNRDWAASGIGAARVGVGVWVYCTLPGGAGLTTFRKNTSRGFLTGFKLGNSGFSVYKPSITDCECSNTRTGIELTTGVIGATIRDCYMEGGDGLDGILDNGNYTQAYGNSIFPGYTCAINSSSTANYGSHYVGNLLSAGSVTNCVLIKLASTASFGGPGKTCRGNMLTFTGSGGTIAGVVGIQLSGLDPSIDWAGNHFDPRGPWVGGAGTTKISDTTTSTPGGSRAKGHYGFGMVAETNYNFPAVNQGVFSVAYLGVVTATSAAQTLKLDHGGWYDITFAGVTTISKIADGGQESRIVYLNVTNGNIIFSNNANLKLEGGVNWQPGANGGLLLLRVFGQSGGFVNAQEITRVAY
ncbi:MAG: hypothetical protein RLZZ524_444 [Pseudomonadota bacterium]